MDKKDYNTIVISLKDKVFRFARAILNNHDDAQDVTQDIFEKLWLKRNSIPEYNNIESYVIRSTKNLCFDRIKHKNVVIKSSEDIKVLNNGITNPEIEKNETSFLVRNAINNLPEKQKIVIHLRDIEGYEFNEIAQVTGLELNALRVNLSRARKAIKQDLIKTMNYGL